LGGGRLDQKAASKGPQWYSAGNERVSKYAGRSVAVSGRVTSFDQRQRQRAPLTSSSWSSFENLSNDTLPTLVLWFPDSIPTRPVSTVFSRTRPAALSPGTDRETGLPGCQERLTPSTSLKLHLGRNPGFDAETAGIEEQAIAWNSASHSDLQVSWFPQPANMVLRFRTSIRFDAAPLDPALDVLFVTYPMFMHVLTPGGSRGLVRCVRSFGSIHALGSSQKSFSTVDPIHHAGQWRKQKNNLIVSRNESPDDTQSSAAPEASFFSKCQPGHLEIGQLDLLFC
jgi:hypothetical protein